MPKGSLAYRDMPKGSLSHLKLYVSFAEYSLFYRALLPKGSLAALYLFHVVICSKCSGMYSVRVSLKVRV